MEIVSEHCKETLCLNSRNDFCDALKNLQPGSYTLRVLAAGAVRFEIEECVFDDVVCIELNGECVDVCAVIKQPRRADITVTKCMENGFGERFKPERNDTFRIQLLHDKEKQECVLNRSNDWTATFAGSQTALMKSASWGIMRSVIRSMRNVRRIAGILRSGMKQ